MNFVIGKWSSLDMSYLNRVFKQIKPKLRLFRSGLYLSEAVLRFYWVLFPVKGFAEIVQPLNEL